MEYIEIIRVAFISAIGGGLATYILSIPKRQLAKKAAKEEAERACYEKMQHDQNEKLKALEKGIQSLLRSEIQRICTEVDRAGTTTQFEKNNLSYLFNAYKGVNGNSYIEALYFKTLDAPTKGE